MTNDLAITSLEQLYHKYLQEISGAKFTFREVDVIACIMHNKGEKKIASILSISHRTVGVHVRNILSKFGGSSKDQIKDMVERSGKLPFLQEYYLHLSIQSFFKNQLQKIGALTSRSGILCLIDSSQMNATDEPFLNKIIQALKLANISLVEKQSTDNNTLYKKIIVINSNKPEFLNSSLASVSNNSASNTILISFNHPSSDQVIDSLEQINFEKKENHLLYFSILRLVEKIIDSPQVKALCREFQDACINLKGPANDELSITKPYNKSEQSLQKNYRFFIFTILCCIILTLTVGYIFWTSSPNKQLLIQRFDSTVNSNTSIPTDTPYSLLYKAFDEFSTVHISRDETEYNYQIVKQFDLIVHKIQEGRIKDHFNDNFLTSTELIYAIHNLNSIASYYLFREHDANKATKILAYAKNLAENFLSNRSRLKINFDKLTPAELSTELSITENLPEVYTVTLYYLGRSALYQGDKELAQKYFMTSKYLGEQLDLLEGMLSVASGLAILKGDTIDIYLKNGNIAQAKKELLEIIEYYKELQNNVKQYRRAFSPHKNSTIIIPKSDPYTIIECNRRIIQFYTKLIQITDSKNETLSYLEAVSTKSPAILKLIANYHEKSQRLIANLYNTLGDFLLVLYDKGIDFSTFKQSLTMQLNLSPSDYLGTIYQIFDLSKLISRSTEFTKANAYDGLIKVLNRKINEPTTLDKEKEKMLSQINEFREARDLINKELGRLK